MVNLLNLLMACAIAVILIAPSMHWMPLSDITAKMTSIFTIPGPSRIKTRMQPDTKATGETLRNALPSSLTSPEPCTST